MRFRNARIHPKISVRLQEQESQACVYQSVYLDFGEKNYLTSNFRDCQESICVYEVDCSRIRVFMQTFVHLPESVCICVFI